MNSRDYNKYLHLKILFVICVVCALREDSQIYFEMTAFERTLNVVINTPS